MRRTHQISILPIEKEGDGLHPEPRLRIFSRRSLSLNLANDSPSDVKLYDLRRTCASYLAISGENLPTIQNVLNHRSLSPTSIYARLNTKATDRALQAQADRFCRSLPSAAFIEQATGGSELTVLGSEGH